MFTKSELMNSSIFKLSKLQLIVAAIGCGPIILIIISYHIIIILFLFGLQERARAEALGYADPINPNYEATSEMYHKTLTECLRRIKDLKDKGKPNSIGIMVASHNEDTVRFAIEKYVETVICLLYFPVLSRSTEISLLLLKGLI